MKPKYIEFVYKFVKTLPSNSICYEKLETFYDHYIYYYEAKYDIETFAKKLATIDGLKIYHINDTRGLLELHSNDILNFFRKRKYYYS